MNLVVSGTRQALSDEQNQFVTQTIKAFNVELIIVGCAKGVDELVRRRFVNTKVFKADWDRFGNFAGNLRNLEMLKFAQELGEPFELVAFPIATSKGTKHCIEAAKKMGVKVHEHTLSMP